MATHSSVLAWRIPGTAEPGGLMSLGLHRVELSSSSSSSSIWSAVGLPGGLVVKSACNAGTAGEEGSSLGWEGLLEEGMATHSCVKELDTTEATIPY